MGAAQSKNTSVVGIVNKSVSDVVMSNTSKCSSESKNIQNMSFSDIKIKGCKTNFSNISQTADVNVNFSCIQNNKNESELLNEFKTSVDKNLKASLGGLPSAILTNTENTAVTNIRNEIESKLNISNISDCMNKTYNDQRLEFGKIDIDCTGLDPKDRIVSFDNISQKLVQTLVAKCVADLTNISEIKNPIEEKVTVKEQAENKGIDFFTAYFNYIIVSILIVVLSSLISSSILFIG